MTNKGLIKKTKSILIYTLSIYIILSFVYLLIAIFLQININKVKKNEIIKNEERMVNVEKNILSNKIDNLISDLLYISDNLKVHNFDINNFKDVKFEWKAFADRKKIYDQIRYIDSEGNEKIRINYSKNGSVIVNKGELQNKKKRYYFKDTIGLKKNQIYISKMDLNIENGKLEEPIKPMIRLATPVFGKDTKLKGIVILNYYAENLLKDFDNIASTSLGNMFLLDSNGYWIYNDKNKNKEWSFMYEDKKNISFKNEFRKEWDSINNYEKGNIITSNGYYTYVNIIPCVDKINNSGNSIVLGEGNWLVVSFIPKDSKNGDVFFENLYENILDILKNNKINFLLIFIVCLSFGVLLTINKISKERIKYFSEYDTMTGVYNRRAGFELLDKIHRNYMKNGGRKASVCFVDINSLKEVNDNLGHEAGDELILSVVNVIKKCIRQVDFVTRLGGDEFLISFINMNKKQAENAWSRINDEYRKINETENRKYLISASHGIEEFKSNSNEYIDNIINSADEKMYNEKRSIKKNFNVIRKM